MTINLPTRKKRTFPCARLLEQFKIEILGQVIPISAENKYILVIMDSSGIYSSLCHESISSWRLYWTNLWENGSVLLSCKRKKVHSSYLNYFALDKKPRVPKKPLRANYPDICTPPGLNLRKNQQYIVQMALAHFNSIVLGPVKALALEDLNDDYFIL